MDHREAAIMELLYPNGFKHFDRLPVIQKAIGTLLRLVDSKVRITASIESSRINSSIMEMREKKATWVEIKDKLAEGNAILTIDAIKHRHRDALKKQVVLNPATEISPELRAWIEEAKQPEPLGPIDQTGRTPEGAMPNSHPEDSYSFKKDWPEPSGSASESSRPATEDSPVVTVPSQIQTQKEPKIPHSEDAFIVQMRKEGKQLGEMAQILTRKGITCTTTDVSNRFYSLRKESQPKEPESLTDDQKSEVKRMKGFGLRNVAIARRLDVDSKLIDAFVMAEDREQAKADALKNDPQAYARFLQGCKNGTSEIDPEDKDDEADDGQ